MNREERARWIEEILNGLFPNPQIPLDHKDPYTLLVAVILSAQCQDARVNRTTKGLFAKAASPEEMIKLSVEEIEELIRPCGLFRRKAISLHELSQILISSYGGKVPTTFEELEALPGVGHKTASVLMSQAFHVPAFPVDTHIHRCAKRWGLSCGSHVLQTEADLKALFPSSAWNKIHLQIIYYARAYCPALAHHISSCQICNKINSI